jgi:hypothetical protein
MLSLPFQQNASKVNFFQAKEKEYYLGLCRRNESGFGFLPDIGRNGLWKSIIFQILPIDSFIPNR